MSLDEFEQFRVKDSENDIDISEFLVDDKESKKPMFWQELVRLGVQDPLAGAAKMIRNVGQGLPNVNEMTGKNAIGGFNVAELKDEDINKFFKLPKPEDQAPSDYVAQALPDFIGAALVPSSRAKQFFEFAGKAPGMLGKILPTILGEAATQGAYGAAVSPEGEKATQGILGAAMTAPFAGAGAVARNVPSVAARKAAAAGAGTAGGLAGYYAGQGMGLGPAESGLMGTILGGLGYKGVQSPDSAKARQLKGATKENTKEMLDLAKALGIDITPSEATGKNQLAREHARLSRGSDEGSEAYYQNLGKRQEQEQGSIKRLLKTIFNPEKMDSEVSRLYKSSETVKLPPEFIQTMKQDPIIGQAIKQIEKDPVTMEKLLSKIPEEVNSYPGVGSKGTGRPSDQYGAYWDTIKKYLDAKIDRIESKAEPSSIEKLNLSGMKDARRKLLKGSEEVQGLDSLMPDYQEARMLSERKIARRRIEDTLRKKEVQSGPEMYNIIKSDEKFDDLVFSLRNEPEAIKMLEGMRKLFKESKNLPKGKTVAGLEGTGMLESRNFGDALKKLLNKIVSNGKVDSQAVDFIYGGQWPDMIDELNKITDRQLKIAKATELFGKMAGSLEREATQEEQ